MGKGLSEQVLLTSLRYVGVLGTSAQSQDALWHFLVEGAGLLAASMPPLIKLAADLRLTRFPHYISFAFAVLFLPALKGKKNSVLFVWLEWG